MFILTLAFWIAAGNRAVRTFAQAAVAILTAGSVGILEADLAGAASAGGLAALVSILMSIATPGQVEAGSGAAEPEDTGLDLDADDNIEQFGV